MANQDSDRSGSLWCEPCPDALVEELTELMVAKVHQIMGLSSGPDYPMFSEALPFVAPPDPVDTQRPGSTI